MTRPNRRGPWLPDEDETLLRLVCSQGPNNWVRISQHMQHRSPKQCRERYHQNLKPSLNHEPISAQEGELIEQMVEEMGKRWAEIARRLRNRSDNAVKNWWNGSMNRRKRNIIQHGHSMKGVGSRLQPIPAAKPFKTTMDRADRRRHHPATHDPYEHEWIEPASHESQRSRQMTVPAFSQNGLSGSVAQAAGRQNSFPDAYSLLSTTSRHPRYNANPGSSRYLPSPKQSHQSGASMSQPHTQTFQQLAEQVPQSQRYSSSDRFGPAALLLNSQHPHEPPLVSPAATEVSHAPSFDRAPSLVSDNQSINSISPRTVPSPRPDMPAPIDTDIQAWARQLSNRRDSLPGVSPHSSRSQGRLLHPDEGYISALPQSAVTNSKAFLPPLSGQGLYRREADDPFFRSSQHDLPHPSSASTMSAPAESPITPGAGPSSKDARMHLSNLLG